MRTSAILRREQRVAADSGLALVALLALLAGCAAPATRQVATPGPLTAMQATQKLVDGNARFVSGLPLHPRQTPDTREQLANGQQPFAVILGCSDSRTGPEIVFDQGLGDLFVARGAGNVIDDHTLGSIEYAVEHLHAPLIVVLGHERCGAVAAARDTVAAHGHAEGHVESLVEAIRPAVEATLGQDAEATCRANVRNMVAALRSSEPILKHLADSGAVQVIGAYYDLDSGAVTLLGDS